jgi:hypothetical protein
MIKLQKYGLSFHFLTSSLSIQCFGQMKRCNGQKRLGHTVIIELVLFFTLFLLKWKKGEG